MIFDLINRFLCQNHLQLVEKWVKLIEKMGQNLIVRGSKGKGDRVRIGRK